MKRISIDAVWGDLAFEEALDIAAGAAARAKGLLPDAMTVVAWYDRRSKRSSPEVGFSEGEIVNWETCGMSRGADVRVEMGDGAYVFLCGASKKH
jgi:hypothetical protein